MTYEQARWLVHEHRRCFGLGKGLVLGIAALAVWPFRGRCLRVPVPGSRLRALVRLGTSDVAVFNTTFVAEEYRFDLPFQPGVIIDAGAYTGLSAIYFALRYPEAQIIAIEPDEANFRLLQANTECLLNVELLRAAVWAKRGEIRLEDPGEGSWGFRVQPGSSPGASRSVDAISVQDVLDDFHIERIGLLKIDIEGSELEVFEDSAGWIRCSRSCTIASSPAAVGLSSPQSQTSRSRSPAART